MLCVGRGDGVELRVGAHAAGAARCAFSSAASISSPRRLRLTPPSTAPAISRQAPVARSLRRRQPAAAWGSPTLLHFAATQPRYKAICENTASHAQVIERGAVARHARRPIWWLEQASAAAARSTSTFSALPEAPFNVQGTAALACRHAKAGSKAAHAAPRRLKVWHLWARV